MAEMKDIVKLAVDAYKGKVENYSVDKAQDVLRQALIDVNGGSTILDYKRIRDGKCTGLFTLIETILSRTVVQGLQSDDFFNAMVDFRNVPEGDQNLFIAEDNSLFIVADVARGTQGIRRQRLGYNEEFAVKTNVKAVKIYEELSRVLSGRVDFNKFITKVSESFQRKLLDDIYALWNTMGDVSSLGGETYFPAAGAYDEDALLELIAHVEAAANGRTATIIGTKKAIRNLAPAIQGADSRSDLYNMGYYGKFYGSPVVATPQRHKVGTTDFVFDDDVLTIVAGDEKMLKVVREGNPLVIMGNPLDNADLTQEYLYAENYGCGIAVASGNSGIGRYEISTSIV